jgi:hypothetical protein
LATQEPVLLLKIRYNLTFSYQCLTVVFRRFSCGFRPFSLPRPGLILLLVHLGQGGLDITEALGEL